MIFASSAASGAMISSAAVSASITSRNLANLIEQSGNPDARFAVILTTLIMLIVVATLWIVDKD